MHMAIAHTYRIIGMRIVFHIHRERAREAGLLFATGFETKTKLVVHILMSRALFGV